MGRGSGRPFSGQGRTAPRRRRPRQRLAARRQGRALGDAALSPERTAGLCAWHARLGSSRLPRRFCSRRSGSAPMVRGSGAVTRGQPLRLFHRLHTAAGEADSAARQGVVRRERPRSVRVTLGAPWLARRRWRRRGCGRMRMVPRRCTGTAAAGGRPASGLVVGLTAAGPEPPYLEPKLAEVGWPRRTGHEQRSAATGTSGGQMKAAESRWPDSRQRAAGRPRPPIVVAPTPPLAVQRARAAGEGAGQEQGLGLEITPCAPQRGRRRRRLWPGYHLRRRQPLTRSHGGQQTAASREIPRSSIFLACGADGAVAGALGAHPPRAAARLARLLAARRPGAPPRPLRRRPLPPAPPPTGSLVAGANAAASLRTAGRAGRRIPCDRSGSTRSMRSGAAGRTRRSHGSITSFASSSESS